MLELYLTGISSDINVAEHFLHSIRERERERERGPLKKEINILNNLKLVRKEIMFRDVK